MSKYKLEEYRKNVFSCARCGVCVHKYNDKVRKVCPSWEHSPGFETYNARGKMMIARGILEGRFDYSPNIVEALTYCTTCGNCVTQCGMTDTTTGELMMVTPEIVEAMRTDAVDLGLIPAAHKYLGMRIEKTRNSYGEPKENRMKWSEGLDVSFVEAKKQ